MRIALDVTPLLGDRSGVGTFTAGAVGALGLRDDLSLVGYALTGRGRGRLARTLPSGVDRGRVAPALVVLALWDRGISLPPAEWLTGPVDVVHGTNFVVPPTRAAARVVTVHDLTAVTFPELCTPASRRYPSLVRRAVKAGAWVHTPSEYVAAEVGDRLGVPAERVRVIPHGVDELAEGGVSPVAGRYVLALGTVEPRKDLPLLVRAFDEVASSRPDVRLVIAGADGWAVDALARSLAAMNHRDRVIRLAYVSGATRASLLRAAALLAVPSVYEGFGLPALEAMSVGVPVVTTAAGAVPGVVGDGAVVVPVGDVAAFADALGRALDDPPLDVVARGRARAAMFTWARCADGLARLYRDATAR